MQLSQYLKKIGECVSIPVITPYNSVPGQWSHCLDFLTFIFCEFGHRRLSPPVILQSGAIWSRDSVCVPRTRTEWITFCTCQSDKNIPRSQADCSCILWFIQARTFHVWFLNDFQFLSRAELTQKATKMFQCCYFHWNIIYLPHERI